MELFSRWWPLAKTKHVDIIWLSKRSGWHHWKWRDRRLWGHRGTWRGCSRWFRVWRLEFVKILLQSYFQVTLSIPITIGESLTGDWDKIGGVGCDGTWTSAATGATTGAIGWAGSIFHFPLYHFIFLTRGELKARPSSWFKRLTRDRDNTPWWRHRRR